MCILEAERARENASIEFRQHHVHGQIGRSKPARIVRPGFTFRIGNHSLKNGCIGALEHPIARGKRGSGDDHRRAELLEGGADEFNRARIFQARDKERCGRQASCHKRRAKAIDGGAVSGKKRGTIKKDRNDGTVRIEPLPQCLQVERTGAGQIGPAARKGAGRRHIERGSGMHGKAAQKAFEVCLSAFAEIGKQGLKVIALKRREFEKSCIVAVFAG